MAGTVNVTQIMIEQQLTSVKAVSVTNVAGTYLNGTGNNGFGATLKPAAPATLTVDGVNLAKQDRVLLAGQTNAKENGIYIVTDDTWVLTRAADQQSIGQMRAGQYLTVEDGDAFKGALFVLVAPLPSDLGIDALNFRGSAPTSGGNVQAKVASFAGGAATQVVNDPNITADSVVTVSTKTSANAVTLQKVTPGDGTITLLYSADPGAGSISYVAYKNEQ